MSKDTNAEQIRGIYLVGFSGSGKSTIAKMLGDLLHWPVCDLDDFIVQRSGMTIPVIFEREGEPGFRLREADALRTASSSGRFVIATGGGTIAEPENLQFMASKGWIICLEGRPQTLLGRIQQQLKESDPKAVRPMIDSVNPLERIRALKQSRQSAYSLADWTVHTDRLTSRQVAQEILRAVDILQDTPEPPAIDER